MNWINGSPIPVLSSSRSSKCGNITCWPCQKPYRPWKGYSQTNQDEQWQEYLFQSSFWVHWVCSNPYHIVVSNFFYLSYNQIWNYILAIFPFYPQTHGWQMPGAGSGIQWRASGDWRRHRDGHITGQLEKLQIKLLQKCNAPPQVRLWGLATWRFLESWDVMGVPPGNLIHG